MIEIFLHQRARATEFVKVDPDKTVEDFALECAGKGAFVWFEDAKDSLKPEMRLSEFRVTARCHVHVSFCSIVEVKVRYAGDIVECSVSPATTIGAVHKWAASPEGFKLTDSESAKHVLVVCGTNTDLNQSEHIGCFSDDDCSVCLDLLPKERFEGRRRP